MYREYKRKREMTEEKTEKKVDFKFLGASGVRVSNLCLGTMTFGRPENSRLPVIPSNTNEYESYNIMSRYAHLGGNFLDSADIYWDGLSEQIVGNWLAKRDGLLAHLIRMSTNPTTSCRGTLTWVETSWIPLICIGTDFRNKSSGIGWQKQEDRSKFVIATKVRFNMDPTSANKVGLSRRHMVASCEGSLERLKTNYIDLYQSHCWDNATPLDETLRTFDDLIRAGKIRYFGCSNVCGWQLQKIVDKLEMMGLNKCVSLQQQYNLLCRQPEIEEFMVCRNEGLGVLPWSPLKGGLLTGKYKKEEKPTADSGRIGFVHQDEKYAMQAAPAWSKYVDNAGFWKLMDTMSSIAKTHGKTIPQVALRWLIQKDHVSSVIIGATSIKQLEDNMGASAGWEMTKEEMASLDEVAPRPNPYPYEMIWRANGDRSNPFNRSIAP